MKLLDKEVLFEDNHLLVVDKPAGLLTLPSEGVEDSAVERGKAYLKEKYNKPGNVYLHQAHRLDRAASGIVVLAKTSKALSRLNKQIREGVWEKQYIVRLDKKPSTKEGELINYMRKEKYRASIVEEDAPFAKRAHLTYRVRDDGLIEVRLITGRYHQIRLQFAAIGCPIRGDRKYGSKKRGATEGIDLHHRRLDFMHPVKQERITIESHNYLFG